jgi:hypothetical protein
LLNGCFRVIKLSVTGSNATAKICIGISFKSVYERLRSLVEVVGI